jgi:predicted ATPase
VRPTRRCGPLSDEFTDGVWLFEQDAVTDPAAVPDAVAAVLGITQQPGKSVADSVAAALEGRLRLLVFDNCEHVRDAAADLVESILAQSATVTILATSREGLGFPMSSYGRCRRVARKWPRRLPPRQARTTRIAAPQCGRAR